LKVDLSGPAATTALGTCVRRAIDALATIQIPDDLTSMPSLPIPLDALLSADH
jgi:hypothetical protein